MYNRTRELQSLDQRHLSFELLWQPTVELILVKREPFRQLQGRDRSDDHVQTRRISLDLGIRSMALGKLEILYLATVRAGRNPDQGRVFRLER